MIKYMWYKNLASYSSKHMYGSPGGTRTFALLSNATNCPLPDILTSATRKSLSIPIAPLPSPQRGLQSRLHLNRSIQHSSFSLISLTLCNVDLLSALYHIPAFSSCFKTISLLYPSMDGFLVFLSCFVNSDAAVCTGKPKAQVPAFTSWV